MNKADIVELLMTRNAALARALVVLNERQTYDEQTSETTKHSNQRGFNAAHAKRGTSMANFFLRTGFLTPKQMAWWRAPSRPGGVARIALYAGQLLDVAKVKAALAERAADKDAFAAQEAAQEQAALAHKMMHRP